MIYKKIVTVILCTFVLFITSIGHAYAHVSVKPSEAGVGQYVTFTMGVPPEKKYPTTMVRLLMPDGLESVRPLVKPGWKIEMKKDGEGENAKVTEITWSGGAIPSDQKDEFMFSVKVPANPKTIQWKAYQTYSDGSVVSWDQAPKQQESDNDAEDKGPYSETRIVDDISKPSESVKPQQASNSPLTAPGYAGYIALILSIVALSVSFRKNTK